MNKYLRAAVPAVAALSSLTACGTSEIPAPTGSNEIARCSTWTTNIIGSTAVYDAFNQGIATEMGIGKTRYPGFYAVSASRADTSGIEGSITHPTGCTLETDATDVDVAEALQEARDNKMFFDHDTVQPSGDNVVIIAPLLDNGKVDVLSVIPPNEG